MAHRDLVAERHEAKVHGLCLTEARDEVKPRSQQGEDGPDLRVAAGQGVRHGVGRPRLVLHQEVKSGEFPHPMVLGNHRESLIQKVLKAIVIGLHKEVAPHRYDL